jgi:ABC-type lipoprotein export system ATPase subunit
MGFLKQLCDTRGFKLLLITHDDRMIPYADKVYRMKDHVCYEISKDDVIQGVDVDTVLDSEV